jgi:formamidopyrimidine-DNA glycosylase
MPELPDLEVFKGNLEKKLLQRSLLAITVGHPQNVFPSAGPVLESFIHQPLLGMERDGKELFFRFPETKSFAVHLMLNGMFHLCSTQEQGAAILYPIVSFGFDQQILVVSDPRRLCKVRFMPEKTKVPDALSPELTQDYLTEQLSRNPLLNMKAFLIDQKMIKGIGNAYADEILWASRISPLSLCGKLTPEAIALLHSSIQSVLREAISSISQEAPEIISGEIRDFLKVHNPHRQCSPTGKAIQIKKVASKTTYFTEEQILY